MHLKLALISAIFILLSLHLPGDAQPIEQETRFTLQVASFPGANEADRLISNLVKAGERPAWGMIELPGRGLWTRIYIGSFTTADAARAYGKGLVDRKLILEYLVKPAREIKALSRPRSVMRKEILNRYSSRPIIATAGPAAGAGHAKEERGRGALEFMSPLDDFNTGRVNTQVTYGLADTSNLLMAVESVELPAGRMPPLSLGPSPDPSMVPRLDPADLALKIVSYATYGEAVSSSLRGGLWVSGDRNDGLARLRWIVGKDAASAISLDASGMLVLDMRTLGKVACVDKVSALAAPLLLADYISSNEGLFLIVQLVQSSYRYRLHIGSHAPTSGVPAMISGSINLDNNYDSRINPYRRQGRKLDQERPPQGFDSLIGLNPAARWFNLRVNRFVPEGNITFHELAEAHAKLDMGLDYLAQDSLPGAHNMALEREKRLKSQRPGSDVVVTIGSNRVLRSEAEIRQFHAEIGATFDGQR